MAATVGDVVAALKDLKLPSAQIMWEDQKPPPLPYVLLKPQQLVAQRADGLNCFEVWRYAIELYTKTYDIPLKKRLQAALKGLGVAYGASVDIDEKGQVVVTYFYGNLIEQEASNNGNS